MANPSSSSPARRSKNNDDDLVMTSIRLSSGTFSQLEKLRERMRIQHHRQPPKSILLRGILAGVLAESKSLDLSDALTARAIQAKVSAAIRGGKV
jgi:hypothetical protein